MKQVLANYPDIKIVGGPVYTAWAAAPAKQAMEDWMGAGMQIDGIWSDSGMMARPAYEAWLAAGKPAIPAVGDAYNGWLKFWKEKNLGETVHGVNNVPLYSGITSMETIFKALRGEPIPRTSFFAVSEIDAAGMEELVRTDLSDAYFAQDTIPGVFTPPADLLSEIFGIKN
jgi:ribose transport system substrate-binding protein